MAIRFHCALCGKPIEIDDEWADKPVACPYCRCTVTAPSSSTINEESISEDIQTASDDLSDAPVSGAMSSTTTPSPGNAAAVISLILALMAIALLIASSMVIAQHLAEFEAFAKEMEALKTESTSQFDVAIKYMDSHGGQFPPWLLLFVVLQMGMLASAVIGAICAIIALRRRARRRTAIFSLVVCGLTILAMCSGMIG